MKDERKKKTNDEVRRAKQKNKARLREQQYESENLHTTLMRMHASCIELVQGGHKIAELEREHLEQIDNDKDKQLYMKTLSTFITNLNSRVMELNALRELWSNGKFDCWNTELDPDDLMVGIQIHQNYEEWVSSYHTQCGSMVAYLLSHSDDADKETN